MSEARGRTIAPVVAATLGVAVVLLVATPAVVQIARGIALGAEDLDKARIGWAAIARTIWAPALIAALATLLALPAAWWLRKAHGVTVALLLAPVFLPSFLVYASWGLFRAPGTWLGDIVATASPGFVRVISDAQAIGGLALWAWPIGAVTLAIWTRRIDQEEIDALRTSGAGNGRTIRFVLSEMRWGILASFSIVGLLTLGSAIPLHVAQVETYTITLWRMIDETGGSPVVWLMALPLLAIAAIAGALLARATSHSRPDRAERAPAAVAPLFVRAIAVGVWGLSALAPLVILLSSLHERRALLRFWTVSGGALTQSAVVALVVAVCVLGVAVLTSLALTSARPITRRVVSLTLALWIAIAIAPGVLLGEAVLRLSLLAPSLGAISETRAGVVVSHLARFGFLGAAVVTLLAAMEPRELADLRVVHARGGVRSWLLAVAPWQVAGVCGAAVAAFALSMHEIEAAVIVTPPGADNLPRHLLNLLHYNRVEELTAASIWMMGIGLALGALVLWLSRVQWSRIARTRAVGMVGVALVAFLGACERAAPLGEPIKVEHVIGEPGLGPGQFRTPRAIDVGAGYLWVIDRSGRMQRVDPASGDALAWELPTISNGYPCGVTFGLDGLLYIADTHEHRVLVMRPTKTGAEVVRTVGEYGTGDGQFVYPTDVAIEVDEGGAGIRRFYVSEYGGNDRISVFDADWNFQFSFGKEGTGPGVEFARPQSVCFDPIRKELLVVDATNHRVGRFTPDGELLTWYGAGDATPGSELGEFRYPYGCAMLPDGSVLVLEFGNNRVQRIDWDTGAGLGAWGTPGRGEGELAQPWGVALLDGEIYVADAGNQRILVFDAPPDAMRRRAAR
jgi:ABC-type Fe3+ transport system permease subunit/DNA-binding beta-propeller fold protein YncE